ncbi:MAG: S-adenosylmethionine synthetase N-terminal domain-containing protein [Lachnospiraceae bacterium]
MSKIYTCEQVSNGHPDKICDQIADAVVTDCLQHDKKSRVAIECLLKDKRLVIAGELTSSYKPDYRRLANEVFDRIGREKLGYGMEHDPDHQYPGIGAVAGHCHRCGQRRRRRSGHYVRLCHQRDTGAAS